MALQDRLERQAELLGKDAQRLSEVVLGIVGLGGNGSIVALGAGCAGFRQIRLFDPDRLELSNCNRFFAGGVAETGQHKVDLVRNRLLLLDPSIRCIAHRLDVRDPRAQLELSACDYLLACPDNDETRAFLQEFCLKHRIPLLEIGSGVRINDGEVSMLGCKMSLYLPGGACLGCICLDDVPMAQSRQSFVGTNLVAAGLALTTLVAAVTGRWQTKNFVAYDALRHEMVSMNVGRRTSCPFCAGESGRRTDD